MARDLKLEVVLKAIDKVTKPFRNITQDSGKLAKQLKATRDQLKELNSQQSNIAAYKKQQSAIAATSNKLNQAQDHLRQLKTALSTSGDLASGKFKNDFRKAHETVRDLTTKLQNQRKGLTPYMIKLREAGISTNKFGEHESRLKTEIDATNRSLNTQKDRLAAIGRQQGRMHNANAQYQRTQTLAGSMASTGAGAIGAGVAMGAPVLGVVKSYISFEDAMLGVAKQVDGARNDNGKLTQTYFDIATAIKRMAEEVPMATTELAALVEGGARMGIQGKTNLLDFSRVAANAATAFELPADALGENLARIANLYKLPIKNISQLGDAINYLDDNAQSKGSDIIDVLQRTAGITASVGMSFKDAAALGSTFLTLGASAEIAATATNAMIRELAIATQQPKKFQEGLKAIGIEAGALQAGMTKDATGTLQTVLKAIKQLPQDQQLSITTKIFGKEFGDDAAKLATNIGEYQRQLELANSAGSNGSMQREAEIRADALSSRWKMSKNRLFNFAATLGETLRPALIELIDGLNNVLAQVTTWAQKNPELIATLLKVVAGVGALSAAGGTLAIVMAGFLGPIAVARYGMQLLNIKGRSLIETLLDTGKAAEGAAEGAGLLSQIWSGLGVEAGNIAERLKESWLESSPSELIDKAKDLSGRFKSSAKTAFEWSKTAGPRLATSIKQAAQSTWAYTTGPLRAVARGTANATHSVLANIRANGLLGASYNLLRGSVTGMWNVLRGGVIGALGSMSSGVRLMGQAFIFAGRALLLNPIGLLITAIAVSALLIYKYWQPIKAFVAGFWDGLMQGIAPVKQALLPAFTALGTALAPLKPLWEGITSVLGAAWGWFSKLLQPIQSTSEELHGATESGRAFGLWLAGLINSLADLIGKMFGFGADLISGLINGITSKFSALKNSIIGIGASITNWFKEKLGIHSPSRVFAELGGYTMAGLSQGIERGQSGALASISSLGKQLAQAGALTLGMGVGSAIALDQRPPLAAGNNKPAITVAGDTIQITIEATPGTDTAALEHLINKLLNERERNKAARLRSALFDTE